MTVLEVRNLKKSFRSPDGLLQPVLDIPSLSIGEGEQIALAGTSGSGKTTLLNIVAGILRADSGEVHLCGEELGGLSEGRRDALRARVLGYVFQTFNLLQGYSALENVLLGMMFGGKVDRSFARSLLDRLGLGDRLDYRPAQLSVGQQQRVALARSLANRPRLVIADEPTGNLDPHHARESLGLMRESCEELGASLLLVSHDPHILRAFDQTLDLSEINRVIEAGSGEQVGP